MSFRPPKTLPILTIFHNARNPQSCAALELLKSHCRLSNGNDAYRIDIVDAQPPTVDQLRQVASFLPKDDSNSSPWKHMVRKDAPVQDWAEIAHTIHENPEWLQRPIVVDWNRGAAAVGQPDLGTIEKLIRGRTDKKDE
ncbi:thioredoxin-like protein [Dichotomocladium elegans]|nr:thioredoxin-like protein [Dichotomocladium elegans]